MAITSDPNQQRTLQADSLQPVFLHQPPIWAASPIALPLGWEVTEDYPLSKRKAVKENQCLKNAPCKSHLLLAFGSTGSWVVELPGSAVTAPMEIRISVLLLWLFADSSHSGQKPCQPWGCPGCSKKQMEGLTSPAPLHPLQDWSSNWAHVKTRRSNHLKAVQKTYRTHWILA